MKTKTAAAKHDDWVKRRRLIERLEVIPHIVNYRRGLRADEVRQLISAGKSHEIEVHIERVGDAQPFSSVHPAGTEPGPTVFAVHTLDDVLDEYATSRDLGRSNKVAALDERVRLPHFDGGPVAEEAAAKQLRAVREKVMEDAAAIRGVRDHGLPVLRPPSPSAGGKVSLQHMERYALERAEQDALLDLEAQRLRTFRAARLAEASKQLPEFTRGKLKHVLDALPPPQRKEVEQAIAGSPEVQKNIYVVARRIVGADGLPTAGFTTRRFNAESGGRPTPEWLAPEFGQRDGRGIRVQSVAELVNDARELLHERTVYGEAACAEFPRHKRGLFVAPDDIGPTGQVDS